MYDPGRETLLTQKLHNKIPKRVVQQIQYHIKHGSVFSVQVTGIPEEY
jgi:hypothetical protein